MSIHVYLKGLSEHACSHCDAPCIHGSLATRSNERSLDAGAAALAVQCKQTHRQRLHWQWSSCKATVCGGVVQAALQACMRAGDRGCLRACHVMSCGQRDRREPQPQRVGSQRRPTTPLPQRVCTPARPAFLDHGRQWHCALPAGQPPVGTRHDHAIHSMPLGLTL